MRVRRLSLALALSLCAGSALAADAPLAPTVKGWAEAIAMPQAAGAGVAVANRTLRWGHVTLTLATGRLIPLTALGRGVGAYFSGTGTMTYVSTDPFEAAVYRGNADAVASLEVDAKGAISEPIEAALIFVSDGADALADGAAWRDGEVSADTAAALRKTVDRFAGNAGLRPEQLLPEAIVDPPSSPAVMVEVVGAKHDFSFVLDTVRDQEESIAVLLDSRSDLSFLKDRRYPQVLSIQPLGRGRLDPAPRRFMLTAVDATVVNPAGLRAQVATRETFQAVAPVRVLDLSLWSDRIGTVGPGGTPTQNPYVLDKVTMPDGAALPFSHLDGDLLVELPRTLAAGEEVVLDFSIAGDVLFNPGGDAYWELPTASWLPVPDRLDTQYETYHAVVKVPKPFTAFSCGRTVRRWEEGGMACAEFAEDRPIQIPVVLAGRYNTESDTRNGLTVSVSTYGRSANPAATEKLIKNTFALIEFYGPFLGDYPFSELKLIEINSYGFGQAPAGVLFITKEAFSPLQDEVSRYFSQGINARLAHEIAHAWWGHVAKLGAPEDQWMSESLAEYFSAFAMGRVRRKSDFTQALDDWKTQSKFIKDRATVTTANEVSGGEAGRQRYALLYAKGPLVLNALREEIGDKAFFTICKSFLKSFDFKYAETRQFIGLTNFVTKKDYTAWFQRYLEGTDWPKS